MKSFGLQAGTNYIDNDYGHIYGVRSGKITSIEVCSQSPGQVDIVRKIGGFEKEHAIASITVAQDGYGSASGVNKLIAYGDTIEVSGVPVTGNNKYSIVCYYE